MHINITYSIMKYLFTLLIILAINNLYSQINSNGTGGGAWSDPNTWDCGGCTPEINDDVNILSNDIVITTGNKNCNNLTINNNATLSQNNVINIYGNYENNGQHNGPGRPKLRGINTTISGTGSVDLGGERFLIRDGDKTILTGTNLVINDRLHLNTTIVVQNFGTISCERLTGNSSRTWINEPNSTLIVEQQFSNGLMMYADAVGNTVIYRRFGTGNSQVRRPQGSSSQFYNLIIDGDNLSSEKRVRNDIIILNDLTVTGSTFHGYNNNRNIEVRGQWNVTGGQFTPSTSTVIFNGSSTQTINNFSGAENFNNLTISGIQVDLGGNLDCSGDIVINSILETTSSNFNVNLGGNWTNNGTFNQQEGNVTFDGSSTQGINGSTNWNNLTINSTGVDVNSGIHTLIDSLKLESGNFSTGGDFTLVSSPTKTARIAEITGGSISGDITVQRFINAGATNWRFFTSPVGGATLAQFNDDFITSGYTGSDYPLWPSASNPWQSIYFYDETLGGNFDAGYVAATNATQSISNGIGIWVYCGDTITGTQAFITDLTGPAQTGNISPAINFTNAGSSDDGWNMIGNPYPSPIDWDGGVTLNNVDNIFYIWNPDINQYASYTPGVPLNGASNVIPSGQAFLVKATASGASVDMTESIKTTDSNNFLKAVVQNDFLKLRVERNGSFDECAFRDNVNATNNYDNGLDALKRISPDGSVPSIFTTLNTDWLAINTVSKTGTNVYPLQVIAPVNGVYDIKAIGTEHFDGRCIYLEELSTGNIFPLNTDTTYQFNLLSNNTTPQFNIHLEASIDGLISDINCFGDNNGEIEIIGLNSGSWDYLIEDAFGNTVTSGTSSTPTQIITGLNGGNYSIQMNSNNGVCPNLSTNVTINEPSTMMATASISDAQNVNDGEIDLSILGGTAPYSYFWATGQTTSLLTGLSVGIYLVEVTDANGCQQDFSFDVNGNVLSIEEINSEFNVLIKENSIEINSDKNNIDKIEVYNSAGAIVKTSNNGIVSTENLATGIYNFVVYTNNKIKTIKIKR